MSSISTTELTHLLQLGILRMCSPEFANWKCMVIKKDLKKNSFKQGHVLWYANILINMLQYKTKKQS